MNSENAFNILAQEKLLTWASLAVGIERGWVSADWVSSFAVDWLCTHPDSDDPNVTAIAGGRPDTEVLELVRQVAAGVEQFDPDDEDQYLAESDRWRFAFLTNLVRAELPDDRKMDRLQSLYAEFGYPADMAACSRYGPSAEAAQADSISSDRLIQSPLEAMRAVAVQLGERLRRPRTGQPPDSRTSDVVH